MRFGMSIGLSRFGASLPISALAVAERARANAQQVRAAADRMRGEAVGAVQPPNRLTENRLEIREQVMADRGLDRLALMRLNAQARIEAEISINAETADRARQGQIRTTGCYLDLKA